ncbi:hypothetical protein [Actinomadura parmotrematis]|uniref:Tetratricopeptide repeat protein n=1 Tax=Actinomadura parmotrematis TaxID=2864039 RepID=A0ABS7FZ47_9ACTN|nr:hypothetical protein [Actinomadura parmotrematis]MBW8485546.1 hypothetical protein [Actinomadura parmotrematis]
MPLEPRFRRVAALNRRFVDRVPVLEAFGAEIARVGSGPRVFNVVGVGGIGKSRLIKELRERSAKTHRIAVLDLQIPAMRQQEDALAVLRVELGRQGVRFDRFDIAYAVLWQRLHPHLRLTSSQLPFIRESEALSQILDTAAGVPVFGTSIVLVRLLEKATSSALQRRRIKVDDTLRQLDELTNVELADAVTYLFAEDLRNASADKPYVLFVDAYEALLAASSARPGQPSSRDVWLRDLIAQLDLGLTVVASREPVGWQAHDPAWSEVIREVRVDGLPMEARLELLTEGGIADDSARHSIATASQGLPFYLHLAVDTGTDARQAAVVSSEQILQRFLQHVGADEIRTLELLSVARVFDFEIFQAVADAFDLPRHRMAWESLTAYSFVYPAGAHGRRLHQLMRSALLDRLSPDACAYVHAVLRRVWDERAKEDQGTENGVATLARAVREAAYSALHDPVFTGEDLLGYADKALTCGGKQAVDGVLQDLHEYLRDAPEENPDLAQTARCLESEAAILLGDADAATWLTPVIDWPLSNVVGARLAIAGAHGRRIAGDTGKALAIFRKVWQEHTGPVRPRAGYCMTDLDMCQGRFRDTFAVADEIARIADPDDHLLRGDLARLRHLAYRFTLHLGESQAALDEAAALYEQAGTIVEPANIITNRAELLAWTDPQRAVDIAGEAVETHRELGALHELGKAYTAMAIAHTHLGGFDEAAVAFRSAADALDRARYRSGRARAELFRALLYIRTGYTDHALASARWAVNELIEAEVYPTLIMMAEQVLDAIGVQDAYIASAARDARTRIDALDSLDALRRRSALLVAGMLEGTA